MVHTDELVTATDRTHRGMGIMPVLLWKPMLSGLGCDRGTAATL